MSRSANAVSRWTLYFFTGWIVLGGAGCSSESPPIAAINSGALVHESAEAVENAAGNAAETEASTNGSAAEPSLQSDGAAAPETPESAVLALLNGLSANQPDALWEALPESYQQDVSGLASRIATRLHPEAWRWFAQIANKSRGLLPDDDSKIAIREPAARLLEWMASGDQLDLEQLKRPDPGRFLRTRGRSVMADVRQLITQVLNDPEIIAALHDVAGPLPDVFQDPTLLKLAVKSADGEQCTLEIQLPVETEILAELYKFEMEFSRVEGKWVPKWLADNWPGLIVAAGELIDAAFPSERALDNFGIVFRYLAQLDAMVEFELAAARGEQAVEPTLFDVVDYLIDFAEDLGLPIPAKLRGGEVDSPLDSADDSEMAVPERKDE